MKSVRRISLVLILLALACGVAKIPGTNSYFTSTATVKGSTMTAGYWIPKLTMAVDLEKPDGEDDWYKTDPCITLESSLSNTIIHYAFSDGSTSTTGIYDGRCVKVPEGKWSFAAYGIYDKNDNWKSDEVSDDFKVDLTAPGDVVVNEVMWMGSLLDKNDQWIELRNTTKDDIDISGWTIDNAHASGKSLVIPDKSEIKAGGYFLITKKDEKSSAINVNPDYVDKDLSLDEDYKGNGQLVLSDKAAAIIDSTPSTEKYKWPAGIHGLIIPDGLLHWSMERNDDPSDGWHTCDPMAMDSDQKKLMKSYWDDDDLFLDCGTPGNHNLSKNDPTSSDFEKMEKDVSAEMAKDDKKDDQSDSGNDIVPVGDTTATNSAGNGGSGTVGSAEDTSVQGNTPEADAPTIDTPATDTSKKEDGTDVKKEEDKPQETTPDETTAN